jgi:hypothetical protein
MTSQLGLLAVQLGDHVVRDETFHWFSRVWEAQPELDNLVLYTGWGSNGLIVDLERAGLPGHVDLRKPLQMYFQPGGAAAFLAGYAAQTQAAAAVDLARELLLLNVRDTSEQLTDERTVHLCKFARGAAELLALDPIVDWTAHLVLMAQWFVDRQDSAGAWSPSSFILDAPARDVDRMWRPLSTSWKWRR